MPVAAIAKGRSANIRLEGVGRTHVEHVLGHWAAPPPSAIAQGARGTGVQGLRKGLDSYPCGARRPKAPSCYCRMDHHNPAVRAASTPTCTRAMRDGRPAILFVKNALVARPATSRLP